MTTEQDRTYCNLKSSWAGTEILNDLLSYSFYKEHSEQCWEDIVSSETRNQDGIYLHKSNTQEPCCVTVETCQPSHYVKRLIVISDARVIEVYGIKGEYLKTYHAEPVAEVEASRIYCCHIDLPTAFQEVQLKFLSLLNPGCLCLYAVHVVLEKAPQTGRSPSEKIDFDRVQRLLKEANISEHATKLMRNIEENKYVADVSGMPKSSTTTSSSIASMMGLLSLFQNTSVVAGRQFPSEIPVYLNTASSSRDEVLTDSSICDAKPGNGKEFDTALERTVANEKHLNVNLTNSALEDETEAVEDKSDLKQPSSDSKNCVLVKSEDTMVNQNTCCDCQALWKKQLEESMHDSEVRIVERFNSRLSAIEEKLDKLLLQCEIISNYNGIKLTDS